LRNPDAELRRDDLLAKMHFAAGPGQVDTLDALALADEFLGSTLASNVLALGCAWQRGLVPLSLAAMEQALRLNGVAVEANLRAFALGRLAAGDPASLDRLRATPAATPVDETLDELLARAAAHLTGYQNAAWAARYLAFVQQVQQRERELATTGSTLPMTTAVARSLLKLMSYKDEYEVARLYTDGQFQARLQAQFEGPVQLRFHMAPPLLSPARDGQPPRKLTLGPWLMTALRWLAKGKVLRGGPFDLFGRTSERRLERDLIRRYEARIDDLWPALKPGNLPVAVQIAQLPLSVRGFGHVKLANLALAQGREAELLHRFDPARHPRAAGPVQAGQFKGIGVVAG
jgi:indolepyruvate ferredoxin oxidoreductase